MEDGGCACFAMSMLENIGRRTKKLSKFHPTIVAKFSFWQTNAILPVNTILQSRLRWVHFQTFAMDDLNCKTNQCEFRVMSQMSRKINWSGISIVPSWWLLQILFVLSDNKEGEGSGPAQGQPLANRLPNSRAVQNLNATRKVLSASSLPVRSEGSLMVSTIEGVK